MHLRLLLPGLVLVASIRAAPPPALVTALEYLRDQKSYSWEVINADPGPVAYQMETRRGTVTTVQQNLSPNIKGSLAVNGDMLIRREWSDGLRLDTIITADGAMVTKTPEGWMTEREILTAQADERVNAGAGTARALWLRRADRPNVRRPDQELTPLLKTSANFDATGDSFTVSAQVRPPGAGKDDEGPSTPSTQVTITLNLRGGMIRDYEVKVEGTVSRARVALPVSDQRIVVLTYVPVTKIDIPDEARAKLDANRPSAKRRTMGS